MADSIMLFGQPEEQLAVVNEAIYAILKGGQSYKIGTRQLTRANLDLLYDMQLKLQAQIVGKEENHLFPDTVVAVFDGR
jgi:hypothetical protein